MNGLCSKHLILFLIVILSPTDPGCIPCQLHAGYTPIILDHYANGKLRNMLILRIVQYGTTQTRDAARNAPEI